MALKDLVFDCLSGTVQEVSLSPSDEAAKLSEWSSKDKVKQDYMMNSLYLDQRNSEIGKSLASLLNMLWSSMDSGEIPQSKAFYDAIKAVNDKYPEPV